MFRWLILPISIGFAVVAAPAFADVRVTFSGAERYNDRDFYNPSARAAILKGFEAYLVSLGTSFLKPGQVVKIDVRDIDLAGEFRPWRSSLTDVRVMTDTTPPRFRLRYTFSEGRRVLARGEETVTDMNYLSSRGSGEYGYEKVMLRDWFQRRFVERQPPQAGW